MSLKSLRKVAAWAAAAIVVPTTTALAQAELRGPQWPVIPAKEETVDPDDSWSKAEIEAAQARCNVVAKQYGAVFEPVDPIRDGGCGTPFPVKLVRIGKVSLSQPATVNCEVVAGVAEWMKQDVQPAAKRILGQRIVEIEVLSSYSCRNAYGRKRGRLSEHARANALDIKGFKFDRDQHVEVLADWGMTERDINSKIAAAEKAARKIAEAAEKAKAEARSRAVANARPERAPQIVAADTSPAEHHEQQRGIGFIPSADGLTGIRGLVSPTIKGGDEDERAGSVFVWGQPSRLGGPKARQQTPAAEAKPNGAADRGLRRLSVDANGHTPRQRFLREIHDSACKRFGTALGPEANEAHRNHLHIDLADRGAFGSYCR